MEESYLKELKNSSDKIDPIIFKLVEVNSNISILREQSYIIQDRGPKVIFIASKPNCYVLKIRNIPLRIDQNILERYLNNSERNLSIIADLSKANFPVSSPIPWNDGSFIRIDGKEQIRYSLVLYQFVEGELPLPLHSLKQFQFGKTIAELHNHLQKFDVKTFNTLSLDNVRKQIQDSENLQFKTRYTSSNFYDMVNIVEKSLNEIQGNVPKGIIHTDLHNYNLIRNSNNIFILDFDGMTLDYLALDIACFIGLERIFMTEIGMTGEFVSYENLLAGYNSIRKLSRREVDLFPLFLANRLLHLITGWISILNRKIELITVEYRDLLINRVHLLHGLIGELIKMTDDNPSLFFDVKIMQDIHEKYYKNRVCCKI